MLFLGDNESDSGIFDSASDAYEVREIPIISVPNETKSESVAFSVPEAEMNSMDRTVRKGQFENLQVTIEELKHENAMLRNQVIFYLFFLIYRWEISKNMDSKTVG